MTKVLNVSKMYILDVVDALSLNWSQIIPHVEMWTDLKYRDEDRWRMNLTQEFWNKVPELLGSCKVIDYDMFDFKNHTPVQLTFFIAEMDNTGISLYVEERNKALTKRLLIHNSFSYSGTRITIPNLLERKLIRIGLKMSQIIDSAEDPNKDCKNYPDEKYSSYRSCDESMVYNDFKHSYGFMPFYAANQIEEVSNTT